MYSQRISRRHLMVVQAALAIMVVIALMDRSGGLAAPQVLGKVDLNLNLDSLVGDSALQASAVRQSGGQISAFQAFDALNQKAGYNLTVTWDNTTGVPRFLAGQSGSTRIPYTPSAAERGNPLAIARGFLDENRALFQLTGVAADFGVARIEPDLQLHFSNVRMPQVYKGIPVFGKQLVVHLDAQEQVVAVNGQYQPNLAVATEATITREQAEQVALDDLKESQLTADEAKGITANVLKDKTALNVYVDDKGKATLTWSVKIMTASPLGSWTSFVNARRPVVVHALDSLADAKTRETYTARNGTNIPGRLLVQEGERTNDAVAQAAHDAAGTVYDYYFNTFKRDSVDGQGSPIVSTVHYGSSEEDAENAAWIEEAQQMVYGDGGNIFKPLAYGLDVVGHELTHGVTGSTAQLIYEGQSGALNESYSDIFGAMIDRANWTLGEQVVNSPPYPVPYLRSLEDPELRGRYDPSDPLSGIGQPGSMSDYANLPLSRRADNGGVHINSGIPSHAAYFVAQAISKEKMEQIYYRTLTQYLSPDSDFSDAAQATVQAATDLYGATEANAVRTAFGQVGINVGGSTSGPIPPAASTPTPGTSSSSSSTPVPNLPTGCRDLTINGGFENASGWTEVTSNNTQILDTQLPHTGTRSAWLGGTDKESLQYIYQDVAIPSNATSFKLTYYRLIHTEFSGLSGLFAGEATFTVLLADTDGNQIATVETLSSADGDDTWHPIQFDLTQFAGHTIRFAINANNPRGNVSSLFIDDVTMPVCTTGQAPSAPTTTSDRVFLNGYIKNADTGRGISGAQLFILKPGISASSAASDGSVTDDEVLTSATSDGQGYYTTEDAIPRGQSYSAILIAGGYRPIVADNGINISSSASNPTEVDATMRVAR